jgi:DNA replication protein DnaC
MLNNTTSSKLQEMKLGVMARVSREQEKDPAFASISFEERFGLIVDAEWNERKNRRLARLIKNADFTYSNACIEDIEYLPDRKLDKSMITRLSTCNYIAEKHNVIILGATGSGKTYIADALGMAACRNYLTVKNIRLPDLLGELAIARGEGTYRKVIKQYKQVQLLILDEWLLMRLTETESRDLLEIIEARYKRASTIFCSQFEVAGWHVKINEPTLADAICDRIAHDSYTIFVSGNESMRKRKGLTEDCVNPK